MNVKRIFIMLPVHTQRARSHTVHRHGTYKLTRKHTLETHFALEYSDFVGSGQTHFAAQFTGTIFETCKYPCHRHGATETREREREREQWLRIIVNALHEMKFVPFRKGIRYTQIQSN